MERSIFKTLAEQGYAPKLLYQDEVFRIEEYIECRTLTIFEMKNDLMMEGFGRLIRSFHDNMKIADIAK